MCEYCVLADVYVRCVNTTSLDVVFFFYKFL
nr:MAG TPA: hypothetical protein [Caudoviricetes sp.]